MADKLELSGADDQASILTLLERVAGIIDTVQACQQRMEARQLELEGTVKGIQADVQKLAKEHAATSGTVTTMLDKTRKVSCHIKDVRVRLEKQNLRVKKVEETQAELLTKNKFRVVIYQGDSEIPAGAASKAAAAPAGGAAGDACEAAEEALAVEPSSDEEYVVVEEADSAASRMKKTGLKRIESLKATFSRENMTKTRESLGSKVSRVGERIVSTERRDKIRQSGERLKERLNLKKERTVAEGQEGAEGATEGAAPVPPPKGRKSSPGAVPSPAPQEEAVEEGKGEETEVPMYDMKQLA